ncbi:MAG TPA: hypothetical protein VFP93_01060, partial [Gammaproteobacteria bacterium]|nr:hypothetical protein [Gammaproteobacteria bacterium]
MNIGPMILQGVLEILQNALKSQAATLNDAQISNLAQRWHRYEIALGTLTAQANIPMESTIKNIAVAYEDAISAIGLTEHQKKQVSLAKTLFMLIKKVHINLQEEIHKLYFKQKKLEKVLLLLTQESKLRALELDLHLAILLHQESLRQQKLLELQNLEPHRLLLLELKTELDSILTTYQTSLSQLHSQRDILRERQSSIDMQLQSVSEQKTHLQNAIVIATEDLQKIVSAMEKTPKILEELVQFTQTSNAQIQTLESDLILWNKAEAEIEGL